MIKKLKRRNTRFSQIKYSIKFKENIENTKTKKYKN